MLIAFLSALWSLFGAVGNFRASNLDNSAGFQKLATISIVLGALYSAVCAFESFGLFAAASQRLPLIRIYAFLSAFTSVVIVAVGLTRVVVHFTMKNDIITECTSLNENRTTITYPYGFFGPVYHDSLDAQDAQDWCTRSWNHDSWSDVIGMLITLVLAIFFTVIAWSYYRQVLDPNSVANRARAPINNAGNFNNNSHYTPPYNASVPNLGYGYNMPYAGGPPPGAPGYGQPYGAYPAYAPPAGPPPGQTGFDADDAKPPGYTGADGKAGGGYTEDKKEDENPFSDFSSESNRRDRV